MALYMTNELAFEVPDEGIEDRTLHELDAPLGGDEIFSVTILRTPLPAGSALSEAVLAHVKGEARRLSFHRVLETRERATGGTTGIEVVSTWKHRGRELHVRELHVAVKGMRLTFSAVATAAQRPARDAYFDRMISTLDLNPAQDLP